MRKRIAFSLIVLALASTLVGGATLALFTDRVTADPVTFTTGTVEITGRDISIVSIESGQGLGLMCWPSPPDDPPDDPSKKTLTWCVENTGSKAAYIRVRARGGNEEIEKDTAAVINGESFGNWWRNYFTNELFPKITKKEELIAGQNYHAGWVTVYRDWRNLYVHYETTNGWTLTKTHVYAETEIPSWNLGAGQFRSQNPNLDNVNTDLHIIPFREIFSNNNISWIIYLATHANVEKLPVKWELNPDSSWSEHWILGNDGWWYYETPVVAGEKICINLDVLYYDSEVEYQLEAQAVQASHNAIDIEWEGHPLQ